MTFERNINQKIAVRVIAYVVGIFILTVFATRYQWFDYDFVKVAWVGLLLCLLIVCIVWGKVPPDFSYKVEEIENRLWIQKGENDRQWFDKHTMYIAVKGPKYLVIKDRSNSSATLCYNREFLAFLQEIEASDC